MSPERHPRDNCYFCGEDDESILETHHVVPRRFGGSDDPENLVDVCPSCHGKLEELYGPRFYDELAFYRRSGETPDGQRIPDNSLHFFVSYDEEGYRQYTCRHCDPEGGQAPGQKRAAGVAFFDQEEAIEHLDEQHNYDYREVSIPVDSQRPGERPDPSFSSGRE